MKSTRRMQIPGGETLRGMGDEALHLGRNVWLAGLGAFSMAQEKSSEIFEDLVEKGKKLEKADRYDVAGTVKKATRGWRTMRGKVETKMQEAAGTVLHKIGVPTHDEIRTLMTRVEQLSAKVQRARAAR